MWLTSTGRCNRSSLRVSRGAALVLATLGALSVLGGCSFRSPECSGNATAPVDVTMVVTSLERRGLEMRVLERAAECGADEVNATLEDDEEGATVRCVVRRRPIYERSRVVRLADSADGAAHFAAGNVECFVDAQGRPRDDVIADVRSAMTLMLG